MLYFPLLGLLAALYWCWRFWQANLISPAAWLLHLVFAAAVLFFAALTSHLAPGLGSKGWRLGLWHLAFGLWLLFFNLAAAGNFLTRTLWGDALSAPQMWELLRYEPVVAETVKANAWPALLGLTFGAITLWLLYRLYLRLAAGAFVTARAKGLRRAGLLLFASLVLLVSALLWRHPAAAREEPLIAFAGGAPNVTDLNGLDSQRKVAAELDRQAFQAFAAPGYSPRTNVVLILADSVRADHFPFDGYARATTPFLSELQQRGKLQIVEDAFSACSESFCGIAATLTGKSFHKISLQSLKLYELLAKAGYANQMILAGNHDTFADLGKFYGESANREVPERLEKLIRHGDDRLAIRYVDTLEPYDGKPKFFFFFLYSTHVLGQRLEGLGSETFGPQGFDVYQPQDILPIRPHWNNNHLSELLRQLGKSPAYMQEVVNHYDNNLLQGDYVLRRIFEGLRAKGYLDDALVVISGDHGDALGEHDAVGHGFSLYNEMTRIPLLLWDSGSDRRLAARSHASQTDIVPTILDRLDLPIPKIFSGSSLYEPRASHISVHMTRRGREPCAAAIRSVAGGAFDKLIVCHREEGLVEELYDLQHDPAESRNLLAEGNAAVMQPLLGELRESLHFFYGDLINSCERADCI